MDILNFKENVVSYPPPFPEDDVNWYLPKVLCWYAECVERYLIEILKKMDFCSFFLTYCGSAPPNMPHFRSNLFESISIFATDARLLRKILNFGMVFLSFAWRIEYFNK